MKTRYLLPHSLKLPGWIILGIGLLFGVLAFGFDETVQLNVNMPALHYEMLFDHNNGWFKITNNNITDELAGLLIIIGTLFITFSQEKIEDEFIMKKRLESLVWAVIVNSILMIFSILAFYGMSFFIVLIFNAVSIQILFMIKFKLALKKRY